MVVVNCDGSCDNNRKWNGGGYGAIVKFGNRYKVVSGFSSHTKDNPITTQIMELEAIYAAVSGLKPSKNDVVIYSDSEWSVNVINGKYQTDCHSNLIARIKQHLTILRSRRSKVTVQWKKGHSGDWGNDTAHLLANYARLNKQTSKIEKIFDGEEDLERYLQVIKKQIKSYKNNGKSKNKAD